MHYNKITITGLNFLQSFNQKIGLKFSWKGKILKIPSRIRTHDYIVNPVTHCATLQRRRIISYHPSYHEYEGWFNFQA